MSYRTAAEVLEQMFPVDAGKDHETLRRHTLRTGEALQNSTPARPGTAAAIVVTLDPTFIRSCEDGTQHIEVQVGNVETSYRPVAARLSAPSSAPDTDIEGLIRQNLRRRRPNRRHGVDRLHRWLPPGFVTSSLADAGVAETPILDWFHIAMRLQHLEANRQQPVGRRSGTGGSQGG